MKATILPFFEIVRSKHVKSAFDEVATKWGEIYMKGMCISVSILLF